MIINPIVYSGSLVYRMYLAQKGRSAYVAEFGDSCLPCRTRMLTSEEIRSVILRGGKRAKELVDSV